MTRGIRMRKLKEVPLKLSEITRSPKNEHYPLSFMQEELWVLCTLERENPAWNHYSSNYLEGEMDCEAAKQALEILIHRHDILRASFKFVDDELRQVIADTIPIERCFSYVNLSHLPEAERNNEARQWEEKEAATCFDLTAAPLIHGTLIKMRASPNC